MSSSPLPFLSRRCLTTCGLQLRLPSVTARARRVRSQSAESGTVANPVAATRDCHFARPCRPASALPTILPPAPRRRPALHSVAGSACNQSDPTAGNRHRGRTPLFLWGNPLPPALAGVSLREACAVNNPPRRERAFRFTTQRPGQVRNWCEIDSTGQEPGRLASFGETSRLQAAAIDSMAT